MRKEQIKPFGFSPLFFLAGRRYKSQRENWNCHHPAGGSFFPALYTLVMGSGQARARKPGGP